MTSQSGKQTITIHICLIEYNMRKCGGETIPRPFSKKLKFRIFRNQQSRVLYSLLLYAKLKTNEIYRN